MALLREERVVRIAGLHVLHALIMVCVGFELVLSAGDLGLVGNARLRMTVYEYGGFWPGLLHSWTPNYGAQPWAMFFTYAFLHSGPLHLVVNMITLWILGQAVLRRVGAMGFALLYVAAILGGALCFGLLTETNQPMVGASGGLFGLAGGLLSWNYVDRFFARDNLWPVAQAVGGLIALNLLSWWLMDGLLAWETHLGGFVIGWVAANLIDPRARHMDDPTE